MIVIFALSCTLREVFLGANVPVNRDVLELIAILNDEGFEALAGEVLSEIARGRDQRDEGDHGATPSAQPQDGGDPLPRVQAIPDEEQLAHAMWLLRLRLVEPIRRLAEAERIAGNIQDARQMATTPSGQAVRISFIPSADGGSPIIYRQVDPGDQTDADKLAEILKRLAPEIA